MIPVLLSFGIVTISTIGFMAFTGFFWAVFLIWKKFKQEHFDDQQIFDLAFLGLVIGVLGSRLMYIVLHLSQYGMNIVKWLIIHDFNKLYWLGFILGIYWFISISAKKHKWQKFEVLDWIVPGILMAQSWISFGHFLAGDFLGKISNMPWAIYHPDLQQKLHPVGLYQGILFIIGYFLILWLEKHYRLFSWYQDKRGTARPGFIWLSFLIISFSIEFLTLFFADKSSVFLYLSWYQIILFLGILFLIPIALERSGRWSFVDWWHSMVDNEETEPIRKPMVLSHPKTESKKVNNVNKSTRKRRFSRAKVGTVIK